MATLPINKTRLSLVIDKLFQSQLKQIADNSGISVNGLLNIVISDYLNKNKISDSVNLLTNFNFPKTNNSFIYKSLNNLIMNSTKKNYNQFIDILQDAFVSRELTEDDYNYLLKMANYVPIK